MCGIVGYIGQKQAINILTRGLKHLEYRGYDSVGVAVLDNGKVTSYKTKGKVDMLIDQVNKENIYGTIGIGHTRWATHGVPSDKNAHPHSDNAERFFVVHNGIIENYVELKNMLKEKGHVFTSETDTEVVPHLIDDFFDKDLETTILNIIKKIKGSYAMAIVDKTNPDKIIVVRKDSPLIIGLGKEENYVASDIPALLEYTKNMYILEDGEIAVITQSDVKVLDINGKAIDKEVFTANWDAEQIGKNGYEDYMIKEIFEQPQAIRQTLGSYLKGDEVSLPFIISKEELDKIDSITIIACGTASYAGRVGEYLLEKLTRIPVKVEVGSEYRYKDPIIDDKKLIIILSQSGETADTIAGMREAIKRGAKVIGVTNVKGSTVSRELEYVIHTLAGPEVSVASTKAFTTQLLSLYLIGLYIGKERDQIDAEKYKQSIDTLRILPEKISGILNNKKAVEEVASKLSKYENMFYIGRNSDFPICLEGSHKLKEISYIHAEAYEAGELKHGALALVTEDVPVICLSTIEHVFDKMVSNITEVQARKAIIINIRHENIPSIDNVDSEIIIPAIDDLFTPILAIIPLQLLAYYTAKFRGCDIDQPRNLAKSVTVE
ncbi:glutamine--fructose-6-phosphate transaminase (isomerizing) [Alkaliphilus hydrothermalis]|uniref:Glutamine--fructose-6-phosphate aminotransferase [isomerizing] n=1 Tax=Alkaliphilus hydrothermalis TaxID=1482730 RepID=A0ABS2NTD8_9FIRM|nr:glutamine--fructose-6-phosphate transaminase (isomerizing) [Alkaliphilus hydrothermalis]MBM7616218.1 glucosamine--fructose-6-phosphate aminotransferase (isomerizing) [Alkaliphilus hydrothermalis]